MARRRTTRAGKRRSRILQTRVSSPRIRWLRLLALLKRGTLMVLLPAIALALVAGAGIGLQRAFLQNHEFRLALIDLNRNTALDERRLVEIGAIDLDGSLFAINLASLEDKLDALPELTGAEVERELPGTLRVRVVAREPLAWLELPAHQIAARDLHRGLLVDADAVPFPCTPGFAPTAADLPVALLDDPGLPAPTPGRPFPCPELTRVLQLLMLARNVPGMDEFPIERIEQRNEWSFRLTTRSGVVAQFGLVDQPRQLADYVTVCRHARDRDCRLATIDLIPSRNPAVTFIGSPPPPPAEPPPPRAIPVAEPIPAAAATPRGRDLQSLLERD